MVGTHIKMIWMLMIRSLGKGVLYMKITKYGIREKFSGLIYGVETYRNDGDFCEDIQYFLSAHSDNVWLMESYGQVDYVIKNPSKWYNANYYTPSHDIIIDEVEIVKIELNIEVV